MPNKDNDIQNSGWGMATDYRTGWGLGSITQAARNLITRRQRQIDKPLRVEFATELGTAGTAAPHIPRLARELQLFYDRRSVLYDIKKMLADSPLIAQALQVFVGSSISKSLNVTVESSAARGVTAGNERRAQRVITAFLRNSDLKNKVRSWGEQSLAQGDLFIQCVEYRGELINAKRMPAESMIRNTDQRDVFTDTLRAFKQVDVGTLVPITDFALWQIQHGRWNHTDGEQYGASQFLQLRSLDRIFRQMILDQAARRKTRGTPRRYHSIGNKEKPASQKQIDDYIALNKLDIDTGETEDYYGSGQGDIKDLNPDGQVDRIRDIEFVLNVLFPRTGMAKGLVGFGETVARDILDEQREFLSNNQDQFIDWLEFNPLRSCIDLALLIAGINPDSISYTVQFEERLSEAQKLAKVELYLELVEAEMMTPEQCIVRIAPYLNVKDPKKYLTEVLAYRKEQAAARALVATKQLDPNAEAAQAEEKSLLGEPSAIGRSNVTRITRGRIKA
jgi:hypothetical protein